MFQYFSMKVDIVTFVSDINTTEEDLQQNSVQTLSVDVKK